jgi:hypothetical protein
VLTPSVQLPAWALAGMPEISRLFGIVIRMFLIEGYEYPLFEIRS